MSLVDDALPLIYTVPELAHVAVPAAVGAVAGRTAQFSFPFVETREIAGVLVLPASGAEADMAGLALEILDETDSPIFTEMAGDDRNDRLPFVMGCLAMAGRAISPFPLQRVVKVGDRWLFRIFNLTGGIINVASVSLHLGGRP